VEEVVLPIKMTNALILTDNIPSIKTIESIGEFEKLGTIKWVDDDNVEEAFCYTRIFD
jgi:RimJ/RimL family protein N-acetyltransferase